MVFLHPVIALRPVILSDSEGSGDLVQPYNFTKERRRGRLVVPVSAWCLSIYTIVTPRQEIPVSLAGFKVVGVQ